MIGRWLGRPARRWLIGLIAAAAAALALAALGESRSTPLFDAWQRLHPRAIGEDSRVYVVLIDDASVRALGRSWPWPRYYHARLVEMLARREPAVIGLDMIFPDADDRSPASFAGLYPELSPAAVAEMRRLPSLDAIFGQVLGSVTSPTVIGAVGADDPALPRDPRPGQAFARPLPAGVTRWPATIRSIPAIADMVWDEGLLNTPPGADGVVRSLQLAARAGERDQPGLAAQMLRLGQGGAAITPVIRHGALAGLRFGALTVPVGRDGSARLWFGAFPASHVLSAAEVLAGRTGAMPRGSYVLIGVAATGTGDIATVPVLGRTFGTVVLGEGLDAMLAGELLARPAWAGPAEAATAALLVLIALLLAGRVGRIGAIVIPLGTAIALLGFSYGAFVGERWLIDPLLPLGTGAAAAAALALTRFIEVARARETIHRAFDRYLSPELVARIARDPAQLELGGEERDMTVLFCDVRGFSRISEGLTPHAIIRFLIGLLTPMTDVLLAHRATIDKYVGDAIIAFWNAPLDDPDHPRHAADAALAMIARLAELNAAMPQQSEYPWPGEVRLGIGLNAGQICVGNMGSARRLNYTMIGDTVNLASRIEGLTKHYGIAIAIGDALAQRLPGYAALPIDRVRVVGRDRAERIWALLGGPDMAQTADFCETATTLAELHERYLARDWDAAQAAADRLADPAFAPAVAPRLARVAAIYGERIAQLRGAALPDDWDGVFQAQEK